MKIRIIISSFRNHVIEEANYPFSKLNNNATPINIPAI
jgi:hypothetical protein